MKFDLKNKVFILNSCQNCPKDQIEEIPTPLWTRTNNHRADVNHET